MAEPTHWRVLSPAHMACTLASEGMSQSISMMVRPAGEMSLMSSYALNFDVALADGRAGESETLDD